MAAETTTLQQRCPVTAHAQPLGATPYPEVTEPFCRLPLDAFAPHQRLSALETCCGSRYGRCVARAPFQGAAGRARVPRAAPPLGPSPSVARRRVIPERRSGRADRRRGRCAGVADSQAAGVFAGVPFGACEAVAVRLGPGHPGAAEGAPETFSTSVVLRALSLLQPRSGPARGPGAPTGAVRAARCHALPGGSQRRVGRGLQRDQFSGRLDSAGEL